ncbi:MAG: DMT family transporter [Rhodospirillaceae bacterium]|nr:DMT family transporter [Rhodospirillaceae bacterium]MBT6136814.1 DMT family transporter [Rhodospirillaceae bacterium]
MSQNLGNEGAASMLAGVGGRRLVGYLLLAVLSVAWGLNWPAMKTALGDVPPWTFRSGCVLGGGLALLAIARMSGHSLKLPAGSLRAMLVLSFFNITVWHLSTAFGVPLLPAGRAAIIAFTMPVWAALLASWFLKERLTWRVLVGLGFGLAGLVVLIGSDLAALHQAPLGAGLLLLAALTWATGTVAVKYYALGVPATVLTGWILLIGGTPIVIGMALVEGVPDVDSYSVSALVGWSYSTFVAMVFCQCTYLKVVTMLPATVAAVGTLAIPVVGVVSSAVLLDEPVGATEAIALTLVVSAMFWVRPK